MTISSTGMPVADAPTDPAPISAVIAAESVPLFDGKNGYLVKVRSSTDLAKALERFIDTPGLIPHMGAASRQMAEQRYDVHKVNAVMLRGMGIPSRR